MTTDSPKGPESGLRPEAHERIARWYRDRWGHRVNNDATYEAADHALEAMRPEIEHLLFERDTAQATADTLVQQLTDLRDDVLGDETIQIPEVIAAAGRELGRLTAEVERLTAIIRKSDAQDKAELEATLRQRNKQYGQASSTIAALRGQLARVRAEYDHAVESMSAHIRAQEDMHRAEVSRLREQLAPAKLGAEIHQERADQLVIGLHRLLDRDREIENGPRVSASSEASPIIHSVLLSSDTGVMGEWQAFCSGCEQRFKGDLPKAEFWKDQHLADTLIPQLQANSKLEQNLELGRPSGSERLAPRSDDSLIAHLRLLVARLKDNVRTGEEKGLPNEIAFDDGWCGALVHAGNELETLLDQYGPNGWDAAAQAARSEATPEDPSAHAKVMADQYREFADLIERIIPSPSLRKEGEDSD